MDTQQPAISRSPEDGDGQGLVLSMGQTSERPGQNFDEVREFEDVDGFQVEDIARAYAAGQHYVNGIIGRMEDRYTEAHRRSSKAVLLGKAVAILSDAAPSNPVLTELRSILEWVESATLDDMTGDAMIERLFKLMYQNVPARYIQGRVKREFNQTNSRAKRRAKTDVVVDRVPEPEA